MVYIEEVVAGSSPYGKSAEFRFADGTVVAARETQEGWVFETVESEITSDDTVGLQFFDGLESGVAKVIEVGDEYQGAIREYMSFGSIDGNELGL